MTLFNIFWHRGTNEVTVQPAAAAPLADADHIGEHQHPEGKDVREAHLGLTLFHIVCDLLHQHGPVNMQSVKLTVNDAIVDGSSTTATVNTAELKDSVKAEGAVTVADVPLSFTQVISNDTGSETTEITQTAEQAPESAESKEKVPS